MALAGALFVVTDFGASESKDDNAAAFQAALDLAGANKGGGTVYVPAGLYKFRHDLVVPTGVELRGCGVGGNGERARHDVTTPEVISTQMMPRRSRMTRAPAVMSRARRILLEGMWVMSLTIARKCENRRRGGGTLSTTPDWDWRLATPTTAGHVSLCCWSGLRPSA